jgi:hypothetical protein
VERSPEDISAWTGNIGNQQKDSAEETRTLEGDVGAVSDHTSGAGHLGVGAVERAVDQIIERDTAAITAGISDERARAIVADAISRRVNSHASYSWSQQARRAAAGRTRRSTRS